MKTYRDIMGTRWGTPPYNPPRGHVPHADFGDVSRAALCGAAGTLRAPFQIQPNPRRRMS